MVQIADILEIAPPFKLDFFTIDPIAEKITDVSGDFLLEVPTFLISGKQIDTKTGKLIQRNNLIVKSSISRSSNSKVFNNPKILTFKGDVVINFGSIYPLKTYNSIMTNDSLIVGEQGFNYQHERAEIKYSIKGGSPIFKGNYKQTYSKPIIIKENTSGSDNTLVKFRVFYKGKKSEEGIVELRIMRVKNIFYSV